MESGDLFFDGTKVGVAAIVSLDIGMDSPVLRLYKLLDNEGVSVGVSLDVAEEPSGKGFGDVVVVDSRGGVEILNEYGVVGASGGAHDSPLVDVLDVASLHCESVDDDGEVRHLSSILLESLGAFDGVSILIGSVAAVSAEAGSKTEAGHMS